MLLDIVKCSRCNQILNVESYVSSFIELEAFLIDNVTNLMKKELINGQSSSNSYYYCSICRSTTIGICQRKLLNSPKYLTIDFLGEQKNQKFLDNGIVMPSYILSNIGYRKYKLFGYIYEVQNGAFNACIKENNYWKVYSQENKIDQFIGYINPCNPYIAIYQGS